MRYLEMRGLEVPRDISVVGYDGLALGEMSRPALTTIAAPRREIESTLKWRLRSRDAEIADESPDPEDHASGLGFRCWSG